MTAKLYHSLRIIPNKMNVFYSTSIAAASVSITSCSFFPITPQLIHFCDTPQCPRWHAVQVFPSNTIVFFSFLLWFPQKSRSHSALPSCTVFCQSPSLSYFFHLNMPEKKNLIQITDSFKSIKKKFLEKNS